jgi:hypothetical protein
VSPGAAAIATYTIIVAAVCGTACDPLRKNYLPLETEREIRESGHAFKNAGETRAAHSRLYCGGPDGSPIELSCCPGAKSCSRKAALTGRGRLNRHSERSFKQILRQADRRIFGSPCAPKMRRTSHRHLKKADRLLVMPAVVGANRLCRCPHSVLVMCANSRIPKFTCKEYVTGHPVRIAPVECNPGP